MAAGRDLTLRSRDVFNDHDEWDPAIAQLTLTRKGSLPVPSGTVPPMGRTLVLRCVQVGRCDTDVTLYYDQLELLAQLGLAPGPAAGSSSAAPRRADLVP